MIIDPKTGRIAYHAYLWNEKGGLDFVQYDFDGKEAERYTVRQAPPLITDRKYL